MAARWTFLILLCFFGCSILSASEKTTTDSLMNRLDEVIANRKIYLEKKEARLAELSEILNNASTDRARFDALTNLYDELLFSPSISFGWQ